jgi:uncharacterized protein (DUF1800 family)
MGYEKEEGVYPSHWKLNEKSSEQYDIQKDELFKKYANQSLPINKKRTRAGLTAYAGAWTVKQRKHLLRRCMFGVKEADMTAIASLSPGAAVDFLLNNVPATAPAPPVNNYEGTYPDPTNVAPGATWVNSTYGDGTVNYHRRLSLKSWWMSNIVNQNTSIMEKMVMFMHNNFTVEMLSANYAISSYKYVELLRTHALGNLKTFIKELSKDAAMLRYLNGHYNVKFSPDENYARELQELFTVGKGGPTQYTEPDVKAAARALTGWRVNFNDSTVSFDPTLHDDTNKQFSSYYNGYVLNGLSGANGANELDNLVDLIFTKDQDIAKYYARKIYRFFVYYDIDSNIETNIINGLAQTLINNNWDVKPMISQLLKSDHFFDSLSMDCFISTPIDFFAGTFRAMDSEVDASLSLEDQYRSYYRLVQYAANAGQNLGDPPSVSGWPAFYQVPHFHEMWINSDTLPKRLQTTDQLLTTNGAYVSATARLKYDVMRFANSLPNPGDPDALIDYCVEYFLGLTLSQSLKDYYKSILLAGQTSNYYWTNAWSNYAGSPTNATYLGVVQSRLQAMLTELFRMAERHLG